MADRFGNRQIAALLTLMGLAREVSNTELETIVGFRLTGMEREQLNERGLVSTRKDVRPYVHELTSKGWDWCRTELLVGRPEKARPLGSALYVILAGIERFLRRENRGLDQVFRPDQEIDSESLESQIRTAYRKLVKKPRGWVRLADLRPLLNGTTKEEVDEVLRAMSHAGQAHLIPDSDRKALTEEDHAAAVRIGRQDNHQMAIEES